MLYSLLCIGELLYAIGGVGLTLVTSLIVADLSPLEWRGFITALPDMPYIINAYVSYVYIERHLEAIQPLTLIFYSGFITDGLGEDGWYMLFCQAP